MALDMLPEDEVKAVKPDGPFMLIELLKKVTSINVERSLSKRGLVIRDCSSVDGLGDKWVRVFCRSPEEMKLLFSALQSILEPQ
jgi:histidinol-phosphate/aromatic aminotransferase/cobyric acid decarboxylase-like protein